MNNNSSFSFGLLMGALAAGFICGLLPRYVGKRKNREGWGNVGLVLCILASLIGGFVFAIPAALICTLVIALAGNATTTAIQSTTQQVIDTQTEAYADIERSAYIIRVPDKSTVDSPGKVDLDHLTMINLPDNGIMTISVLDDKTFLDTALDAMINKYKSILENPQETTSEMVNMHQGKGIIVVGLLQGMKYCFEIGAFTGTKTGYIISCTYLESERAKKMKTVQKIIESFKIKE